jgi:hypothetical protein
VLRLVSHRLAALGWRARSGVRTSFRSGSGVWLAFALATGACGDDEAQTPDAGRDVCDPRPDAGGGPQCPEGEICLSVSRSDDSAGRCFLPCQSDDACGPGEGCGDGGQCVPVSGPVDAGMPPMDSGPPERCEGLGCTAPADACHPVVERCVECTGEGPDACGVGSLCDVARGECVSPQPMTCAPCEQDSDCPVGFDCLERESPFERVCAVECPGDAGTCPRGTVCKVTGSVPTLDASTGAVRFCLPIDASCTAFYGAARATSRSCRDDADCVPLGAEPSDGACEGASDAGAGECRLPCADDSDCPARCGGAACSCVDGVVCGSTG